MISKILAIAVSGAITCFSINSTAVCAAEPTLISNNTLTTLPHVHAVTFSPMTATERQIIHLLDWHFVSEADFAADLRDQSNEPISDEDIEELYEEFLAEVEAVQREQMAILRTLIREHGVRAIYKEGLTAKRLPAFTKLVAAMKEFEMNKPKGETPTEQFLLDQYRLDVLQLGAAGRLLLSGELQAVLPAENAEALAVANPVGPDGKVEFNAEANERREDPIVHSMLIGDRVAVIVLGGDHDLADNIRRAARGSCQYVRIEPNTYREARR